VPEFLMFTTLSLQISCASETRFFLHRGGAWGNHHGGSNSRARPGRDVVAPLMMSGSESDVGTALTSQSCMFTDSGRSLLAFSRLVSRPVSVQRFFI